MTESMNESSSMLQQPIDGKVFEVTMPSHRRANFRNETFVIISFVETFKFFVEYENIQIRNFSFLNKI